jgi:iron complex outermembrane receptor protein
MALRCTTLAARTVRRAGFAVLAAAAGATTFAADSSPGRSAAAFPLPEITVTARPLRSPPTLLVRDVSDTDMSAWNAHTVGDALVPVSGVNLQYGGTSSDARAWIRGFRDRDSLVLFDGIPIASGFEGTIDLNEIATEHVSSVRVVKSAPSVIYGSNGLGGVIDVIPRRAAEGVAPGGGVEFGTDARRLVRGSLGSRGESLGYVLSLSHEQADPYSLSEDYPGERNQPAGERLNSDFRRTHAFLSVDAPTSPIGESSFFASVSDAEKGLPPTAGVADPDYERLTLSQRRTVGVSNRFAAAPVSFKAYYNSYDSEITRYTDASYDRVEEVERADEYTWGAKLYGSLPLGERHTVVLYGAGQNDVFEADYDELEGEDRAELMLWNAAIEDQFAIGESLSVAAGAIFTLFDQTEIGRSSSTVNPQVAIGWQAHEKLALHASVAERTRFPKLRELYRRRYGNTNLREQSADNYELGVSYASSSTYTTDFSVFRSDIDDLIERPDRRSRYQNLAPVCITGVEMSTAGELVDRLYTRLSYTYIDAQETLPSGDTRQLRSRPKHTAQFEIRYRFPREVQLSVNAIYVADLYDLDERDRYVELPSYAVANLRVAAPLGSRLSGYVAVSNLTDEAYAQRLGDPREGRSFRLGLEARL